MRHSLRMRRRRVRTTFLLTALAAAIAMGLAACGPPPGTEIPSDEEAKRVVDEYLMALQERDEEALAALGSPEVANEVAARRKIRDFGGRPADAVKRTFREEFGGTLVNVRLVGPRTAGGREDNIALVASQDGRRYHVALGVAEPTGNEASTKR